MAFNPQQKKNIDLLIKSPQDFLKIIKDIDIEEYKKEFFQNGKGLSHILAEQYFNKPQEYSDIAFELFHKGLRLDDVFRQDTPVANIFSAYPGISYPYKDNAQKSQDLLSLVKIAPEQVNIQDAAQVMHCLYNNNQIEEFKEAFCLFRKITNNEYWQQILADIISYEEKELLEFMVDKGMDIKEDLPKIEYKKIGRKKESIEEKSNLLVAAIATDNTMANYLLDNFKFPLNGRIAYRVNKDDFYWSTSPDNIYRVNFPSHTRNRIIYSAILPLEEAFHAQRLDIFKRILKESPVNGLNFLLYKEQIVKKVAAEHSRSTLVYETPGCLIDKIIGKNSEFYQFIKDNIKEISQKAPPQKQLDFIHHVLGRNNVSYSDKLVFAQNMLPSMAVIKEEPQSYRTQRKTNILDEFLDNFYKEIPEGELDMDRAGKILSLALSAPHSPFSSGKMYRTQFFKHPRIMNNFVAHGLDVNVDHDYGKAKPINPFELFIKATLHINPEKDPTIHKNLITLKKLAKENLERPVNETYHANQCLLSYACEKLNIDILHSLSDKDIFNLAKDKNPISYISEVKKIETYEYITKRLFDLGYLFSSDTNKHFYLLLKNHSDNGFVLDVMKKENLSFAQLSGDVNFWNHIESEEKCCFVKEHGADFSSIDTTLQIAQLAQKNSFKHYINQGGNVSMVDHTQDNMLHHLIKQNEYQNANEVLLHYPEMAETINKQKKIPLQYMIADFNRACSKKTHEKPADFSSQKELFINYLEFGKFNEKSKKQLMLQIDKYGYISKEIPNLKEIMMYKVLEASTVVEDIKPVRRNKI